jgi:hypothetical protein
MDRILGLFLASTVIAGCASQLREPVGNGKHLVYRDANGAPTMQIDYPTEEFCRKVEAVARRPSRCEPNSLGGQLQARATLRYDPPGVQVEAHYPDVARCQRANASMAQGVELINPCAPK